MADFQEDIVKLIRRRDIGPLRETFMSMVQDLGLDQARNTLRGAFTTALGSAWYAINRTLLSLFGLEELIGFDGDVSDLLDSIDDDKDFQGITDALREMLIERVRLQVENGGCTLFFDTQIMETKPTGALLLDIANARKREYETVLLSINAIGGFEKGANAEFDEFLLWRTAYGLETLRGAMIQGHNKWQVALEMKPFLMKVAKSLNIELGNRTTPVRNQTPQISERMTRLSEGIACVYLLMSDREKLDYLFESGFLDFEDCISTVIGERETLPVIGGIGKRRDLRMARVLLPSATKTLVKAESPRKADLLLQALNTDLGNHRLIASSGLDESTMEQLKQKTESDPIGTVAHLVSSTEVESEALGCQEGSVFIVGPPLSGLDIAIDIAVNNGRVEIEGSLKRFLGLLPWHHGNALSAIAAKGLARLKGIEAVEILAPHATWSSPKWDCGEWVESSVVDALAILGSDAVPALSKHLWSRGYLDMGIVYALIRIGNEGLTEVSEMMMSGGGDLEYEQSISLITALHKHNPELTTRFILSVLDARKEDDTDRIVYWEHPTELWLERIQGYIDETRIMQLLSDDSESIQRGACNYFRHRPNPDALNPLISILNATENSELLNEAILAVMEGKGVIDKIGGALARFFSTEDEWNAIEVYRSVAQAVHQEGPEAVKTVSKWLDHSDWTQKGAGAFVLGLVALTPEGAELISSCGLADLMHQLFKGESIDEWKLWGRCDDFARPHE